MYLRIHHRVLCQLGNIKCSKLDLVAGLEPASRLRFDKTMPPPPIAAHTLSPMLNDSEVLFLVDAFLDLALAHPVLAVFYRAANRSRLRTMICRFICQVFGGLPFDRDMMATAHRGLQIRDHHYDAFLEVADAAMDAKMHGRLLVSPETKTSVLLEAQSFRPEIVWAENQPPAIYAGADDDLYAPRESHSRGVRRMASTVASGRDQAPRVARGRPLCDLAFRKGRL